MKRPIFKVVIKPIEKEIEIVSEFLLDNNPQNIRDFILNSMNFVNKNKTFFKNLANNC